MKASPWRRRTQNVCLVLTLMTGLILLGGGSQTQLDAPVLLGPLTGSLALLGLAFGVGPRGATPWAALGPTLGLATIGLLMVAGAFAFPNAESAPALRAIAWQWTGAALGLVALFALLTARLERTSTPLGLDRSPQQKTIELGVEQIVPFDGEAMSVGGFVDEGRVWGRPAVQEALPVTKGLGDQVWAGARVAVPGFQVRCTRSPSLQSLVFDRLVELGPLPWSAAARLVRRGPVVTISGALIATALLGPRGLVGWLCALSLCLVGAGGVALAEQAFAQSTLRRLLTHSARPSDWGALMALVSLKRWLIHPDLVAAPGRSEVVVLGTQARARVCSIAKALLQDEPWARSLPEGETLRAAATKQKGELRQATVEGQRWFIGPTADVRHLGFKVERRDRATLGFLEDQGLRLFLLGNDQEGIVAGLGLAIGVSASAASAASALGAALDAGWPSVSALRALGKASSLELAEDGLDAGRLAARLDSGGGARTVEVLEPRSLYRALSEPMQGGLQIGAPALTHLGAMLEVLRRLQRQRLRVVLGLGFAPQLLALSLFGLGYRAAWVFTAIAASSMLGAYAWAKRIER